MDEVLYLLEGGRLSHPSATSAIVEPAFAEGPPAQQQVWSEGRPHGGSDYGFDGGGDGDEDDDSSASTFFEIINENDRFGSDDDDDGILG